MSTCPDITYDFANTVPSIITISTSGLITVNTQSVADIWIYTIQVKGTVGTYKSVT
jgi:hypothetical protein